MGFTTLFLVGFGMALGAAAALMAAGVLGVLALERNRPRAAKGGKR